MLEDRDRSLAGAEERLQGQEAALIEQNVRIEELQKAIKVHGGVSFVWAKINKHMPEYINRLTSGSYFCYFSLLFDPEPYFSLLFKKTVLLSLLLGVLCCQIK